MSGNPPRDPAASGPVPAPAVLAAAVDHLRADGLLAYPTETVYGFGGRATPRALEALGHLKRRDASRPFLLLVPGPGAVEHLAWTPEARALAGAFWPGPLTLVLGDPAGRYPPGVRGVDGGVAVRHSDHPVARALVDALGEPLTSTSANAPGAPPAADAEGVRAALEALGAPAGRVLVVDGGALPPSPPSTLVDCTGSRPRILREGTLSRSALLRVLPDLDVP